MLKFFWKKRRGVTLIEYALIGTLIAVVAIAALTGLGEGIGKQFNELKCQIQGQKGDSAGTACIAR